MWFDVQAALAEILGQPPATTATAATQAPVARVLSQKSQVSQRSEAGNPSPRVAIVAFVATHDRKKLEITPGASDPETYLAHLHASGPTTYGAAASSLGWGATRAWQAEAKLRAAGLVRHGAYGLAFPLSGAEHGKP